MGIDNSSTGGRRPLGASGGRDCQATSILGRYLNHDAHKGTSLTRLPITVCLGPVMRPKDIHGQLRHPKPILTTMKQARSTRCLRTSRSRSPLQQGSGKGPQAHVRDQPGETNLDSSSGELYTRC